MIQEISELEKLFDEKLGPATRQLIYYYVLDNKNLALNLLTIGISKKQETLIKYNYFIVKKMFSSSLFTNETYSFKIDGYIDSYEDLHYSGNNSIVHFQGENRKNQIRKGDDQFHTQPMRL